MLAKVCVELPKPELLQAIRRLAQRSLEFESSDKCPSRDRLASVLMLETRASVTVYLEMFLIFLFGKSFLKWPSTVVLKCRHPEHGRNKATLTSWRQCAGGSQRPELWASARSKATIVLTNPLANSGSRGYPDSEDSAGWTPSQKAWTM